MSRPSVRRLTGFALVTLGAWVFLSGVRSLIRSLTNDHSDWPDVDAFILSLILSGCAVAIGSILVPRRFETKKDISS